MEKNITVFTSIMSEEMRRSFRSRDESLHAQERMRKSRDDQMDEFYDKKKELYPAINMALNIIKMANTNPSLGDLAREDRQPFEESQIDSERSILREKLQEKLNELIEEQQALIELYVKAARAAKDKEEEYRERISELIDQTTKDKQLMDLFKNI